MADLGTEELDDTGIFDDADDSHNAHEAGDPDPEYSDINLFKKNISRQKPIPVAEQPEYFRRWREDGDQNAYERIIASNVKYAFKQIGPYLGYGLPADDLKSAAVNGLIRAAKKFDPAQNIRLISYAKEGIKGQIREAIYDYYEIPKSQHLKLILMTLSYEKGKLRAQYPEASEAEMDTLLCAHFSSKAKYKVLPEHLRFIEDRIASANLSLNKKTGADGDSGEWIDMIASSEVTPEEELENTQEMSEQRKFLRHVMNGLTQVQSEMVRFMHLGDETETVRAASEHLKLPVAYTQELYINIHAAFQKAAADFREGNLNLSMQYETPPQTEIFCVTPAYEAIAETARRTLTPLNYFLFCSVHLCHPGERIDLEDLAEALNISAKKAKDSLAESTLLVIESTQATLLDQDFYESLEKTMSLACGRAKNLENADYIKIGLYDRNSIRILKILKQNLSAEDFDLLMDARLCPKEERKSLSTLAAEYEDSEANIHRRLNDLIKTMRTLVPDIMRFYRFGGSPIGFDDYVPEVDSHWIDDASPLKKHLFHQAGEILDPYKLYILTVTKLAKAEYALSESDLEFRFGFKSNTMSQNLRLIRQDLSASIPVEMLDAVLGYKDLTPPKTLSLKSPPVDESLIDLENPEIAEKYELVKENFNTNSVFYYAAMCLYRPEAQLSYEQAAKEMTKLNPAWECQPIRIHIGKIKLHMKRILATVEAWETDKPISAALAKSRSLALQTLEMALYQTDLTGEIPTQFSSGPQGQQDFWIAAGRQLKKDFNITIEELVLTWMEDKAHEFEDKNGRIPGYNDGVIIGNTNLTWAKVDDILCDNSGLIDNRPPILQIS